ncbi:MAG: site-2 protease family protein, partial [Anaerolineae bacterium]
METPTYRSVYEPIPSPNMVEQLSNALHGLMVVEDITVLDNKEHPPIRFGGQLTQGDQEEIFNEILQRFEALGYTPILRREDGLYVLRAVPTVADKKTGKPWVNAVLFVLTVISVLLWGALRENASLAENPGQILEQPLTILRDGWPFAVTLLGILTAHELSHYFVGRRYGSPTSLPYFIPLPLSILGTMGAVIVQRGPMRSRKALFDIGIAGPLGGLILAIPLLFVGLSLSYVGHPREFMDIPSNEPIPVFQEGNSLLYLGAKYIVHGRVLPDDMTGEDVWLSPPSPGGSIAFAAWAGLLVTALNLFPIGQLDGGHIAFAMWGRKGWTVARIVLGLIFGWALVLLVTGSQAWVTWLVWGGLGSLMGPRHPPPLNNVTPLDRKRKILGWAMVAIF